MIKPIPFVILILLSIPVFAAEPPASTDKEVVTIYYDQLKEKKIDGDVKDLEYLPVPGVRDQTPYIRFRNKLDTARTITVKIKNLTEPEYDLYMNGELVGKKKKEFFESGFPLTFHGTYISPMYRDFYNRLRDSCTEGAKPLEGVEGVDASVCRSVMTACASWVRSIFIGDDKWRTENLILAPVDRAMSLPGVLYIDERPKDFENKVSYLGVAVHTIRREVAKKVSDRLYLDKTLAHMTPMDASMKRVGAVMPGMPIAYIVNLKNWTDRSISGEVKLHLPTGWKIASDSAAVNLPGYGKEATVRFEVTPSAAAKPSDPVSATASLDVDGIALNLHVDLAK